MRKSSANRENVDREFAAMKSAVRSTVIRQRKIQRSIDTKERNESSLAESAHKSHKSVVQAGMHPQPENPLLQQHLQKPGNEFELTPRPCFLAVDYRGSGKLEGMVALITGGDSGIGRAVAVLYAREGANVAIVYLDEHADAEETADWVRQEGKQCLTIAGDVCDSEFCRTAVSRTIAHFGKIDILVNNAAFQEHCDSLEELSEEHLQETLQTNIGGYFHMAKAVLPHLREKASIINTGSETNALNLSLQYANL